MRACLLLAILALSAAAHAGSTHNWGLIQDRPDLVVCEDLVQTFVREGQGQIAELKFVAYGETEKVEYYQTADGRFRLVKIDGQMTLLTGERGERRAHPVQLGRGQHGMCPNDPAKWPLP